MTGSTVFDACQLELNVKTASSFIETTTVAITRNSSQLSFPDTGVFLDSVGTAMCDWMPHYDEGDLDASGSGILTTHANGRFIYGINGLVPNAYDGPNFIAGSLTSINDNEYRLGTTWNGAVINTFVDDTLHNTGAYIGTWSGAGTIYIGSITGVSVDQSNIKNVRFYKQEALTV